MATYLTIVKAVFSSNTVDFVGQPTNDDVSRIIQSELDRDSTAGFDYTALGTFIIPERVDVGEITDAISEDLEFRIDRAIDDPDTGT